MSSENARIEDLDVEIVRKKIKNLHIGCYPPEGRVRVAAPFHLSADAIRLAILTKLSWIYRKQQEFRGQDRQTARNYVSGETHFVFGRPLRLEVRYHHNGSCRISTTGDRLVFTVPEESSLEQQKAWMERWLRTKLKEHAALRITAWSKAIGVYPLKWGIRKMKTKWGSCNPDKSTIWLNLELAKKPERMIDYIILHELAHLISPRHDELFFAVLDREMPQWRLIRSELNALPLAAWAD